ncbi:MAG: hypothetical protein ABJF01_08700, partial [bacterium]
VRHVRRSARASFGTCVVRHVRRSAVAPFGVAPFGSCAVRQPALISESANRIFASVNCFFLPGLSPPISLSFDTWLRPPLYLE